MKSIIEILGGAQLLLDIDFNQSKIFEEVLPEEHKAFIASLRIIPIEQFVHDKFSGGKGRPQVSRVAMYWTFHAKSFFRLDATKSS